MRAVDFPTSGEIDRRGLDQDLTLIWQLRHALPPQSPVREWLHGIPGISTEPPLNLGYKLERIDAGLLGHYGTCGVRALLFDDQLVELRLECSFDEWPLLEDAVRPALGPAFEVTSDSDRGQAKLTFAAPRMQGAARTALDVALGPVLDAPVPLDLAHAYDVLSSPFSRLVVGTACANAAAPPGRGEAVALARAKRFDLLRNVLRGSNPEARIYAARALERAKALTWSDRVITDRVLHASLEVATCSGHSFGQVPSGTAARSLNVP